MVLIAMTVAPGLSASWMGVALLNGRPFHIAATRAGYVLAISFGFLISALPIGRLVVYTILEFRNSKPERAHARTKTKRVAYPIPTNKKGKPRDTHGDKMRRAFERGPLTKAGKVLRRTGERLASAPPPKRLQGKYAQTVSPVQVWIESPEVSMMDKLYHITNYFYGKRVKRDDFKPFGEGWQELYAQYKLWVSDTGYGWVDLDGRGTIVGWRYSEHELYKSDRMLERIAIQNGFEFPGEGEQ
jgi:hypothetical protein